MDWLYNGQPFTDPEEGYHGFVYLITNKETGKKYIGKKTFWFTKSKSVGGKKKKYLAASDWKRYYGSSKLIKEEVGEYGKENFTREILKLCVSKGECSYYEAKYQFEYDVLLNPDLFYNDWIMCKIHRKHVYKGE